MPEWSKGSVSSTDDESRVGSNPTSHIFFFFFHEAISRQFRAFFLRDMALSRLPFDKTGVLSIVDTLNSIPGFVVSPLQSIRMVMVNSR